MHYIKLNFHNTQFILGITTILSLEQIKLARCRLSHLRDTVKGSVTRCQRLSSKEASTALE